MSPSARWVILQFLPTRLDAGGFKPFATSAYILRNNPTACFLLTPIEAVEVGQGPGSNCQRRGLYRSSKKNVWTLKSLFPICLIKNSVLSNFSRRSAVPVQGCQKIPGGCPCFVPLLGALLALRSFVYGKPSYYSKSLVEWNYENLPIKSEISDSRGTSRWDNIHIQLINGLQSKWLAERTALRLGLIRM